MQRADAEPLPLVAGAAASGSGIAPVRLPMRPLPGLRILLLCLRHSMCVASHRDNITKHVTNN